ncbi:hypothetical protein BD779DRAFT_1588700 [Infundibulicybe gibba]|nr:hypothetical protein BD779DRAFT_1588700 [Infundibulicybe gibba]
MMPHVGGRMTRFEHAKMRCETIVRSGGARGMISPAVLRWKIGSRFVSSAVLLVAMCGHPGQGWRWWIFNRHDVYTLSRALRDRLVMWDGNGVRLAWLIYGNPAAVCVISSCLVVTGVSYAYCVYQPNSGVSGSRRCTTLHSATALFSLPSSPRTSSIHIIILTIPRSLRPINLTPEHGVSTQALCIASPQSA